MIRGVRLSCPLHSRASRWASHTFGCPRPVIAPPQRVLVPPVRLQRYLSSSTAVPDASDNAGSSSASAGAPSEPIEWLPLPRSITPRRALLLLSVPVPPEHWPSHLELASPLLGRLSCELKSRSIAVNAVYDGVGQDKSFPDTEAYEARAFWPDGHTEHWEASSGAMLHQDFFRRFDRQSDAQRAMDKHAAATRSTARKHEILICTHGSRDCRCSDRGGALVHALRDEIARRKMEHPITVREIAHVGGHKYAANAILLPSLDMLSNLTVEHAPALVSHVTQGLPAESGLWQHWRGRYGLSEDEQAQLWAQIRPADDSSTASSSSDGLNAAPPVPKIPLRFKTFEGEEHVVEAQLGQTLLEVGKEAGLPALEGVCGGNLECATCHLYLPAGAPISPASEDELDMLGYALGYRDGQSRLGCQIKVDEKLAEWAKSGVISLPRF